MNIKFIKGWSADSDDSSKIGKLDTLDLALCGQGRPEGNAAGLVPVQLPSGVVVTPVVTVTSSTSTTKRNSRSAVIKVAIPYTALTKDEGGNTVVDPTRSGADLSLHIVLALPASAVKDLKGANGSTSSQSAEAQVALVHYLLSALVGQQFGSEPRYEVNDESGDATLVADVAAQPNVGGYNSALDVDATVQPPLPSGNVGGFGGAGFDLQLVKIRKDLNSALGRIANGLPALSCADIPAYAVSRRTML